MRKGRLVLRPGIRFPADIDGKDAVRPESLFRIASISNRSPPFAVLRLVEQGKLDSMTRPLCGWTGTQS